MQSADSNFSATEGLVGNVWDKRTTHQVEPVINSLRSSV